MNTRSGCFLACSAIHCCFVYVFVELSVSSSVSHQWVCPSDAPLPSSGSRWPRFPAFTGTIKALRLPAPPGLRLIDSPTGSAGACRVRVRRNAPVGVQAHRRAGVWIVHAGRPRSSGLAHGQEQDLPGSLTIRPVTLRRSTTPDDPSRFTDNSASGAAPTRLTVKASSINRFRGFLRRFITHCLRFTTPVTVRHARLVSGWRAAPLPGGSRTRWIAMKGFRSSHSPFQGLPWRNKRSVPGG